MDYFAIVSEDRTDCSGTIYGIGHTEEAAWEDQRRECEDATVSTRDMTCERITRALFDLVSREGGAGLSWRRTEHGLDVVGA